MKELFICDERIRNTAVYRKAPHWYKKILKKELPKKEGTIPFKGGTRKYQLRYITDKDIDLIIANVEGRLKEKDFRVSKETLHDALLAREILKGADLGDLK